MLLNLCTIGKRDATCCCVPCLFLSSFEAILNSDCSGIAHRNLKVSLEHVILNNFSCPHSLIHLMFVFCSRKVCYSRLVLTSNPNLYHNQQLKLTNNNHQQRDSDNTSIKIADFGLAKRVHMPQSLTTLCGSLHYVAPELLKNHVSRLHLFGLFVYCSYIKKKRSMMKAL